MIGRLNCPVLDCPEPGALARFYCELLGATLGPGRAGLGDPQGHRRSAGVLPAVAGLSTAALPGSAGLPTDPLRRTGRGHRRGPSGPCWRSAPPDWTATATTTGCSPIRSATRSAWSGETRAAATRRPARSPVATSGTTVRTLSSPVTSIGRRTVRDTRRPAPARPWPRPGCVPRPAPPDRRSPGT